MRTSVTAIVVTKTGEWLDTTLESLRAQTLKPDRVVTVVRENSPELAQKLKQAGVTKVVAVPASTAYGFAIAIAERLTPPATELLTTKSGSERHASNLTGPAFSGTPLLAGDTGTATYAADATAEISEWLWLLTEDAAPEPKALQELLQSVLRAPSVAIAGPKLINWDHPERIVELGQSLTKHGSRWLLRNQELDQEQYDHLQDTLGVGPIGMLVKREVWQELEGFDPALTVYDDGLDLSVRARLAGHRVIVSPRARIRVAMSGIAGPRLGLSRKIARRNHTAARSAQIHRRLTYIPAIFAFCYWLLLPVTAVFRLFWALLREQPGYIPGELATAFGAFFRPGRVFAARRRLKRNNITGWGAIDPLRTDPKTVHTARLIDREALLEAQGRKRKNLHFISTGGLGVLLFSIVAAAILTWWLYDKQSLGGGSAPLSDFENLWANTRIVDGVPADPFTWVLAILGSITFWKPGLALVIFLAASIPLTTLGGWIWGAQFTSTPAGRALAGIAWSLSPVVLGSIDHGRIQTVILATLLPWVLIAATRAHESWAWTGTASLLSAVVLACAPVLIPFAALMLVIGLLLHPRRIAQIFATAIAPAVMFAPIIVHAIVVRDPLAILRDPGITQPYAPASLPHLLLGFPEFGLESWGVLLERIGLTTIPATLIVGLMLLPLAGLALLGVFAGKIHITVFSALLGGTGMVTAIFSSGTSLTASGPDSVNLWTGSGLALYWIAIITLAASGLTLLHRSALLFAAIALIMNLVAVAPLLANLATGQSQARQSPTPIPSIVQAAGTQNPNLQTLRLTATNNQSIRAEIITGAGLRLDQIRTAQASVSNKRSAQIAHVTGALASPGSPELAQALTDAGISYVLLSNAGNPSERAELQAILDEHSVLAAAGSTTAGSLWRVTSNNPAAVDAAANAVANAETASFTRTLFNLAKLPLTAQTVWAFQAIMLIAVFLLALPTGEVTEQAPKRHKNKRNKPVTDTNAAELLQNQRRKKRLLASKRAAHKKNTQTAWPENRKHLTNPGDSND
ncbi:glycosyltransferase [Canibacter sp. lx-72]|uniref:glycosyltransferase n=1 Tax=Canibacter zhuwentaonis TaxID=2837491 RepID=UPI001BDC4A13|nr:glycosyltransferase [Canibacter zhuwentaonis]MBT1018597.1 glycosyltransferase [Canibacter zhuwentaonis]